MQRITSRQNPVVAQYRAAARGEPEGSLLLDGSHLVGEAIDAGIRLRHVMVSSEAVGRSDIARLLDALPHSTDVASAPGPVMEAVSPVRSSSVIVALGVRPVEAVNPFDVPVPLVVVLCDVQDPGNVGAIIRVAEGAGASGVIVAGQSADPFGWKALRGSMGSTLRLPVQTVDDIRDAVEDARRHGAQVVATVPRDGESLFDAHLSGPTALLIGGEGPGLTPDIIAHADARVTIPMTAPVESLNAAVAAAVLLYEARRQRTH